MTLETSFWKWLLEHEGRLCWPLPWPKEETHTWKGGC